MNAPEYILTDVFGIKNSNHILTSGILYNVKQALTLSVLNYQYGYVEELNETLQQWEKSPSHANLKFPLVWLAEPYEPKRNTENFYASADFDLFIINTTQKDWKAAQRMDNNFKPNIYPIYWETLNQMVLNPAFPYLCPEQIPHTPINRYFFCESQKSVLNDVVDCMKISFRGIKISHKQNCTTFSNM